MSLAFRACQAAAAEPVERDLGVLGPVARQQLDVFDRQEQLVAAGIVDLQAVVRRAGGVDRLQADEAADAMVDMNDQVVLGEVPTSAMMSCGRRRLCARRTSRSPRMSCSPITARSCGLEAPFQPPHSQRRNVARLRHGMRQRGDGHRALEPVVGQHMGQPLARALGPRGNDHALARPCRASHGRPWRRTRWGRPPRPPRPFSREVVTGLAPGSTLPGPSGWANGVRRTVVASASLAAHSSGFR